MKTGPLVVMTRAAGEPWSLHLDDSAVRIEDVTITSRPDLSMKVMQTGARTRDVQPGEVFKLKMAGRLVDAVCFRAEDERTKPPSAKVTKALEAVRANDTDDARRVLSDVLEESGALAEAQYVRHELFLQSMKELGGEAFLKGVRELRALSSVVGPTFRYLVGRDIDGCAGVRWAFRCPQSWDGMKRTADERERVCMSCRQMVVQVTSEEDAKQLARDGVCAQVRVPEEEWGEMAAEPDDWVGTVEPPPEPPEVPQWVGTVAVPRPVEPSVPTVKEVKEEKRPWWKRLFGG